MSNTTSMNGYDLSRNFWDWAFDNPEKVSPNHAAIYFFAVEHCNRLGWAVKFGFPSQMTMNAIGIKKHSTYIRYFNDLVEYGFFTLVQKSKNQYSANVISLTNAMLKKGEALDKAILRARVKHGEKQTDTLGQSTGSINKPVNQETSKPLTVYAEPEENTHTSEIGSKVVPPTIDEIEDEMKLRNVPIDKARDAAEHFFDKYSAQGWKLGNGVPMLNWKAKVRSWVKDDKFPAKFKKQEEYQLPKMVF